MEFDIAGRKLYLPGELLNKVFAQLSNDTASIQNARLACKSFCQSASKHMYDRGFTSPSELFTLPETSFAYGDTWPQVEPRRVGSHLPEDKPLMAWTWIEIPTTIKIEDPQTPEGTAFRQLLWAPFVYLKVDNPPGSSPWSCGGGDHRLATSSGRLREQDHVFCIIHVWRDKAAWDAYRGSHFAEALAEFFETLRPGCTRTSKSECVYILSQTWHMKRFPLHDYPIFEPTSCQEIRTIYFAASMTREQREAFQHSIDPYTLKRPYKGAGSPWPQSKINNGSMRWLPGLHDYKGQRTVAARFIIEDGLEVFEYVRHEAATKASKYITTWAPLSCSTLKAAGVVGIESWHCDFWIGPPHKPK